MTLTFSEVTKAADEGADKALEALEQTFQVNTYVPVDTASASLLEAAMGYAARGWPVFPLHNIKDGKCSCGLACSSPGKHPRTAKGVLDATTDPMRVGGWWVQYPDANIGIATGNGLVVLDIDPDKGGNDSMKVLLDGSPPWGTPTVVTGSGGYHFYFKSSKEFRNKAGFKNLSGIDVRGDGGYVVAPPSNHVKGGYEWFTQEETMLDWPWPEEERTAPAEPVDDVIPDGQRNAALASIAGTMRRRGMSVEEIEAALMVINERRCDPPLPDNEVRSIAKSVSRYEPESSFAEVYEVLPKPVVNSEQMSLNSEDFLNLRLPPPQFLIEDVWPERAIGFVSGPPKSFKSFLVLEAAFAVATGKRFLDMYAVPSAKRVLLIQGESDMSSFQDRVRRCKDHYGAAPLLHILSNKPIYLDNDVDVDRLKYEINLVRPELVILDPMASFHKSDENNTQNMQGFVRTIRSIRDELNTAILIVHHWTKSPPGERIGGGMMRGSSSLFGAQEVQVSVWRVADDVNRSAVKIELKESGAPEPFKVQFDPASSALRIVTNSGILFGHDVPSGRPYQTQD